MYVLTSGSTVLAYPYSENQLRRDNPQVSFPSAISQELLDDYGVMSVALVPQPAFDPITQDLVELTPALMEGLWTQVWGVVDVSPEEVQRRQQQYLDNQKALRAAAYREEADPLYFKAQREEATMAEWKAKVSEIKARYPYPEG